MTYGYIKDEHNNTDFIEQQKKALEKFSTIYDYNIDEEIIETENFTQLNYLLCQMKAGDKLITCGISMHSSNREEFNSLLDKFTDKGIKVRFIDRPADIIIHETNISLKRINTRAKQTNK